MIEHSHEVGEIRREPPAQRLPGAMNKVFPSYTLTVDKKPGEGDFTTIQAAVDSLPLINLVRV
ncbi:putative pectinesterase 53 [Apostasia shenzhenica]|uniref:Putative pectinesterase 53 n=1 Tax=Apostasia shenzhenica TaxID=1088818 RepID=A0A2I0BA18_9ASPA|nr:putative pectinesterase 53 [Apostasia shenzhenica]